MFTLAELIKYETNYEVTGTEVYLKSNNVPVTDPDLILKIKSAKLLYTYAKKRFLTDANKASNPNIEEYFLETMRIFSLNGENIDHEINKLITKILSNTGTIEEETTVQDLSKSKYFFLVEPQKDYGLAYLTLKFREKGLKLISLELTSNPNSSTNTNTISISYETKPIIKRYIHPMAHELNPLEKELKLAEASNDIPKINTIRAKINNIITRYPATVRKSEFDQMTPKEQMDYYATKMYEARHLKDVQKYNYYQQKLFTLKSKENRQSSSQKEPLPPYKTHYQSLISLIKDQNNPTPDILFLSEIAYYKEKLLNSLTTEKSLIDILTLLAHDLGTTEFELKIASDLSADLKIKLDALRNPSPLPETPSINSLKDELSSLIETYNNMLSDGLIDSEELSVLATKITALEESTTILKNNYQNSKDLAIINNVISKISEYKNYIFTLLDGTREPKM